MAGFECEFSVEPPKVLQTKCPVCLLVLREPYQATCCGKSFCKECIEQAKVRSKRCPTCKTENFFSYPNKGLQQSLYDFEVYCSHKRRGCEWTGELRELEKHLNSEPLADKSLEGCPFTVINCPLNHITGCEVRLPRKGVQAHLNGDHKPADIVLEATRLLSIKTELEHLKTRLEEAERENLSLKQRVAELEDKETKSNSECNHTSSYSDLWPVGPGEVFLTNFEQRKKSDDEWYSPPFYSHPCGYKMCLRVHCSGKGAGKDTHISLFVHLMRGEFDDQLKWPFCGDITIKLLNQDGSRGHCTRTVSFNDRAPAGVGSRVSQGTVSVASGNGLGFPKFVSHDDLRPKLLKNDCLRFRIAKVKLK